MGEPSSGKWAAEAYDFLRLFRRVSSSIYGLLLVEIGWAFFLVLASRLSPTGEKASHPVVAIPLVGDLRVVDLLFPGMLLWFVAWAMWSGFFRYLTWPVGGVLHAVGTCIALLLGLAAFVVDVLLFFPVDMFFFKRWSRRLLSGEKEQILATLDREKLGQEKIDSLLQRLHEPTRTRQAEKEVGPEKAEILRRWDSLAPESKKALIAEFGDVAIREKEHRVLYEYWLPTSGLRNGPFFSRLLWSALEALVRRVRSRVRIGLAPLQSFSYEEDLNAAKAPAQVFSAAISQMRWQLEGWKALRLVSFRFLPGQWVPRHSTEARYLRQGCGMDVLLWGSYLTGRPHNIWLNIERRDLEKREVRNDNFTELFPFTIDIRHSMLVIDQEDPWEGYIALVLALIHGVHVHTQRGGALKRALEKTRIRSSWQGRVIKWILEEWYQVDELFFGRVEIRRLVDHLIEDAFLRMRPRAGTAAVPFYPEARSILAEIAGSWVGTKLYEAEPYASPEGLPGRLLPVIQQCIAVAPGAPQNYYRLGAIECLRGNVDDALDAFKRAKEHERVKSEKVSYPAAVRDMTIALIVLERPSSSEEAALARYVAQAARAINLAGQKMKEEVREEFEASQFRLWWKLDGNREEEPTLKVLQKLLE